MTGRSRSTTQCLELHNNITLLASTAANLPLICFFHPSAGTGVTGAGAAGVAVEADVMIATAVVDVVVRPLLEAEVLLVEVHLLKSSLCLWLDWDLTHMSR